MLESALIEVRVFPWRLRTRVMKASSFRDKLSYVDPTTGADCLTGIVLGLAVWLAVFLAAPLLVLVLAGLLFSVELPVLAFVGGVLLLGRFAGVVPWTVVVVNRVSGAERRYATRSFLRAVHRVRDVNGGGRIVVRWAWS